MSSPFMTARGVLCLNCIKKMGSPVTRFGFLRYWKLAFIVALLLAGMLMFFPKPAYAASCLFDGTCPYYQSCVKPVGSIWGTCTDLWCANKRFTCSGDAECGAGNQCAAEITYVPSNNNCYSFSVGRMLCQSCGYPFGDCNLNGGCETNLATDNSNCGSCGNACLAGNTCQSGKCTPPPTPICIDSDKDSYYSNAVACGVGAAMQDCNDANAAINPGAAEVCGNGIDEDCSGADLACPISICGNGIQEIGEACDWGGSSFPTFEGGNGGSWGSQPSYSVSCGGGYPSVTVRYRCNSGCSAYDFNQPPCGFCGDGVCNGRETAGSCAVDCNLCGNGVRDAGEACDTVGASATRTQSCGNYPSITQTCNSDCSGYNGVCGRCGDGTVQGFGGGFGPEECEPPQTMLDCSGAVTQNCNSGGGRACMWTSYACPPPSPSCVDNDGDGYGSGCAAGNDCNDANAAINPGAVDYCGNGIDEDCSGSDAVCADPCAGVDFDTSRFCCERGGFQWARSGEPNAGRDDANSQFMDSRGERRAPSNVKLLPNEEMCIGDDVPELFFIRARDCATGICVSDPNDKALCDKPSDCVYNGKCYSDIETVAATFFSNDRSLVWPTNWKREISKDVNLDGNAEVCDPGVWMAASPFFATIQGIVSNVSTSNSNGPCPANGCPVGGAVVRIMGAGVIAVTAADGSYSISNVPLGTYDLIAAKPSDGYDDAAKLSVPVLGSVTENLKLLKSLGNCNDDCTMADGLCHSECYGRGLCSFASSETQKACSFAVPGIITDPGNPSRQILCCSGAPYNPLKADVKVICGNNIVSVKKPVLFRGRLVNMVLTVFDNAGCDRS